MGVANPISQVKRARSARSQEKAVFFYSHSVHSSGAIPNLGFASTGEVFCSLWGAPDIVIRAGKFAYAWFAEFDGMAAAPNRPEAEIQGEMSTQLGVGRANRVIWS
jgi:hypothetical protein